MDALRTQSGSGHKEYKEPFQTTLPKCVSCKEDMGYDAGMHLMISSSWKLHIACFYSVVDRHERNGEVIDLSTGTIHKKEDLM